MFTIKPEEALQLCDQAISQLQANRDVHVRLQQAVEVLKEAIIPVPKPEPKEEKK